MGCSTVIPSDRRHRPPVAGGHFPYVRAQNHGIAGWSSTVPSAEAGMPLVAAMRGDGSALEGALGSADREVTEGCTGTPMLTVAAIARWASPARSACRRRFSLP